MNRILQKTSRGRENIMTGTKQTKKRFTEIQQAKRDGLPESVIEWIANGDRDASSDAMCKAFFGHPIDAGTDHPKTQEEFRRCLLFLSAIDGSDIWRFDRLQDISQEWFELTCRWDSALDDFGLKWEI